MNDRYYIAVYHIYDGNDPDYLITKARAIVARVKGAK